MESPVTRSGESRLRSGTGLIRFDIFQPRRNLSKRYPKSASVISGTDSVDDPAAVQAAVGRSDEDSAS